MYQSRFSITSNTKQSLSLSLPTCTICSKYYDNYYHIPRVMPKCGHTYCQKCIKSKLANKKGRLTFTCPQCEADIIIRKNVADQLPKNIMIAEIVKDARLKNVEQQALAIVCKQHNKKLEMVCVTCKNIKICPHCAVFGSHKGHNISSEEAATSEDIKQVKQFLSVLQDTVYQYLLPQSPQNVEIESKTKLVSSLQSYIKQNFRQYYSKISQKQNELLEQCESVVIDHKGEQCIDEILTSFQILKLKGKDVGIASRTQIQQTIDRSKQLHGQIEKVVQSYNKSIQNFLHQAKAKIKQVAFYDIHLTQKRNLKTILKMNSSPEIKKQSKPKQHYSRQQDIKKFNSGQVSQFNTVEPTLLDKIENKPKLVNASNPSVNNRVKTERTVKQPQAQTELGPQQKNKNSSTTQNQPVQSKIATKNNNKPSNNTIAIKKIQPSKTPDKLEKQRNKSPIHILTNQPIQLKFIKPTKQLNYQFRSKFQAITNQIDRQNPEGTLQLISLQICDQLIPYICDYLFTKKLKFSMLKLVKNNLTDQGFKILLSYLSTDTYTKVLNVTSNHLTQKSLNYILSFITHNNILKTIYISNNKVNQIQLKRIQKQLENKFVQVII